jgi:hypothetical protein
VGYNRGMDKNFINRETLQVVNEVKNRVKWMRVVGQKCKEKGTDQTENTK